MKDSCEVVDDLMGLMSGDEKTLERFGLVKVEEKEEETDEN